jgi:predicted NAD-dependent protein-ADP-ribosyltransferase YbiA (DUF1768 family)
MVKSKIEPIIDYPEDKTVDDDDLEHPSARYKYKVHNIDIEIVLGVIRHTYSKYNVVYYPIYLVFGEEIDSKIGIFEVESNKSIEIIDEDGDVDLKKGKINMFVSKEYLIGAQKDYEKERNFQESQQDNDEKSNIDENPTEKSADDSAETIVPQRKVDDVFALNIPESENKNQKADNMLVDGIFTDNGENPLPMLPEESAKDTEKMQGEFIESDKNEWIEKFTQNNNYKIQDNEGGGDCFFSVIRDAFKKIGKDTTVEKLRAILSKNASEERFQHYRTLFLGITDNLQSVEKELDDIRKNSQTIKKRISAVKNKETHSKLMEEAKVLLERRDLLLADKESSKENLEEFEYMENIDTFEKFKEFILTRDYWADDWAISQMEHLLNIKMIILSEGDFEAEDIDSVMRCEIFNNETMKPGEKFRPDYYIMTSYTGRHYKLITYKKKSIFKFKEIPYGVKVLIINKCMERNSGIYYLIDDFISMKTALGLPADYGKKEEDEDEFLKKDLYDKEVVFRFYANANKGPLAGEGAGEKIPTTRITEFSKLNNKKDKTMVDWRKKIDDTWPAPFTIDSKRWGTVKHYCLAAQFKRGFPDFYAEFSLDTDNKISKNLEAAILAASDGGSSNRKIDDDYETRAEAERKTALVAKFTQNLDLKKVLIATKPARLDHFIRRNKSEVDELLMSVRNELSIV